MKDGILINVYALFHLSWSFKFSQLIFLSWEIKHQYSLVIAQFCLHSNYNWFYITKEWQCFILILHSSVATITLHFEFVFYCIFFFFWLLKFYWSIVDLQCCHNFCCTNTACLFSLLLVCKLLKYGIVLPQPL